MSAIRYVTERTRDTAVSQPNRELIMAMEQTDLKPLQDVEKCEPIRCWVPRRLVKWRKDASLWHRLGLLGILSHATDVGPSPKVHSGPLRQGIKSFDLHRIENKTSPKKNSSTVAHKTKYSGKHRYGFMIETPPPRRRLLPLLISPRSLSISVSLQPTKLAPLLPSPPIA